MSENNSDHIKMFKNGNSFAFRVSKKDREALNATSETSFEKLFPLTAGKSHFAR
ncbi:hypothetical protein LPKW2_03880 [Lactiplantibacillus pentosus]|nr:hypothetical protein LPKW2_03880 [Lactiplantibacillus pentosus]